MSVSQSLKLRRGSNGYYKSIMEDTPARLRLWTWERMSSGKGAPGSYEVLLAGDNLYISKGIVGDMFQRLPPPETGMLP